MGILIRWKVVPSDSYYDTVYVYRATSENGTYTNIASQSITDTTFYDQDGDTTRWYKIRYNKSSTTNFSDYSQAIQGGKFNGYCTITDIRDISELTEAEKSDTILFRLLRMAMAKINKDMNIRVVREKIEYIDSTRENKTDGSNTVFYVKNWKDSYIADSDNDGEVDADDITVHEVDSEGTETEVTVASIDPDNGKFTLAMAPSSNVDDYVTYQYAPISVYSQDMALRLAAANLTAFLAFNSINAKKTQAFTVDKIKVMRQSNAAQIFSREYDIHMDNIRTRAVKIAKTELSVKEHREKIMRENPVKLRR